MTAASCDKNTRLSPPGLNCGHSPLCSPVSILSASPPCSNLVYQISRLQVHLATDSRHLLVYCPESFRTQMLVQNASSHASCSMSCDRQVAFANQHAPPPVQFLGGRLQPMFFGPSRVKLPGCDLCRALSSSRNVAGNHHPKPHWPLRFSTWCSGELLEGSFAWYRKQGLLTQKTMPRRCVSPGKFKDLWGHATKTRPVETGLAQRLLVKMKCRENVDHTRASKSLLVA